MLYKIEGIVLHSFKHGDSGRIVRIFTKEKGLLSFIIRTTYSKKKGSSTALYQALSSLNIDADIRANSTLHKIREASVLKPQSIYSMDPQRAAISMFISEIFLHSLHEEDTSEELYTFLEDWIGRLNSDIQLTWIPCKFLLELSDLHGFYPDLEEKGDYFDMREGSIVSHPPLHKDIMEPEISTLLKSVHGMDLVEKEPVTVDRRLRRKLLHDLLLYFQIHIHHFKPINSHTVLEETFGR